MRNAVPSRCSRCCPATTTVSPSSRPSVTSTLPSWRAPSLTSWRNDTHFVSGGKGRSAAAGTCDGSITLITNWRPPWGTMASSGTTIAASLIENTVVTRANMPGRSGMALMPPGPRASPPAPAAPARLPTGLGTLPPAAGGRAWPSAAATGAPVTLAQTANSCARRAARSGRAASPRVPVPAPACLSGAPGGRLLAVPPAAALPASAAGGLPPAPAGPPPPPGRPPPWTIASPMVLGNIARTPTDRPLTSISGSIASICALNMRPGKASSCNCTAWRARNLPWNRSGRRKSAYMLLMSSRLTRSAPSLTKSPRLTLRIPTMPSNGARMAMRDHRAQASANWASATCRLAPLSSSTRWATKLCATSS